MRLSLEEFPTYSVAMRVIYMQSKILFNNEVRPFVFEADEEQGYIKGFKLDPDGTVFVDPETGDLVEERIEGSVKIIMPEPPQEVLHDFYGR